MVLTFILNETLSVNGFDVWPVIWQIESVVEGLSNWKQLLVVEGLLSSQRSMWVHHCHGTELCGQEEVVDGHTAEAVLLNE